MIGLSPESKNNVLSFLPEIAYRLILQELESNGHYHHNLSKNRDLQKLRTFGSLPFKSLHRVRPPSIQARTIIADSILFVQWLYAKK
jgi:hypothetical protein